MSESSLFDWESVVSEWGIDQIDKLPFMIVKFTIT